MLTQEEQQSENSYSGVPQFKVKPQFPPKLCSLGCLILSLLTQVDRLQVCPICIFSFREVYDTSEMPLKSYRMKIPKQQHPSIWLEIPCQPMPLTVVTYYILPEKSHCIHSFYRYCGNIIFHYFILTLESMKGEEVWTV